MNHFYRLLNQVISYPFFLMKCCATLTRLLEILKINNYKAPRDKLICILNCCKVIFGMYSSGQGAVRAYIELQSRFNQACGRRCWCRQIPANLDLRSHQGKSTEISLQRSVCSKLMGGGMLNTNGIHADTFIVLEIQSNCKLRQDTI